VEPSLVECFLEESHDQEEYREHAEDGRDDVKDNNIDAGARERHLIDREVLEDIRPNDSDHPHPFLSPGASLKQRQQKVKVIKKILMLQQAKVSPEAIHERFQGHPMVSTESIHVVLNHGASRMSSTPRTPSEILKRDPNSEDGCLFQKLRDIFKATKRDMYTMF
jgi:hypothetical protein